MEILLYVTILTKFDDVIYAITCSYTMLIKILTKYINESNDNIPKAINGRNFKFQTLLELVALDQLKRAF